MSKYARILSELYGRAWAVPEPLLLSMQELLRAQASGTKWSDEEIHSRIEDANARTGYEAREHLDFRYQTAALNPLAASERRQGRIAGRGGRVAVIPVIGLISHRMNLINNVSGPGGTSIQKLQSQFREALASDCKAIVLDVDSPGGSVDGVPELASEIYEARKQKPITAVCNSMACSAAYWLASAASEVVCTPSGQCGSIGVYMLHQDESEALKKAGVKITIIKAGKYKAEGNPTEPLDPEAYDNFLSMVNGLYDLFVKGVAQNRGTSQAKVRGGYGQGRSLLAVDAVKQNLADRVGTLDDILGEMFGRRQVEGAGMARGGHMLRVARPEDDEDDSALACHCDCSACQACENKGANGHHGAGAHADDMSCQCACDACKACTYKSGAPARGLTLRQAELDLMRMQSPTPAAGSNWRASLERKRRELDLAK
jgi:signal peptide peptidase SppA